MKDINPYALMTDETVPYKTCPICYNDLATIPFTVLKCGDSFCNICILSYITNKINEAKVIPLSCPDSKCELLLEDSFVQSSISEQLYAKFLKIKSNLMLEKSPNLIWCPVPDCGGYNYIPGSGRHQMLCNKCSFNFCSMCISKWHEDECKRDENLENYILDNKLRRCPVCAAYIEKAFGCPSVTCTCGSTIC